MNKQTIHYINTLSNKTKRTLHSFSIDGEFSSAEGRTLHFILAHTGDLFQKDIEEEFDIRPSTATQLLQRMEKDGLIFRETAEHDARLKRIVATPKAISYQNQVTADLGILEETLTSGIAPEKLKVFYEVVDQILENLDK